MQKKRFLSLRWKAFILTSTILGLVFSTITIINRHVIEEQYLHQRERLHLEYLRETQLIIEQNAFFLQSLAQTFLNFDGMLSALKSEKKSRLENAFNPHWWPFQLSNGLKSAVFYSKANEAIARWGKPHEKMHLVSDSNNNGRPHHYLHCASSCTLYVTTPLAHRGNQLGTLLIGANLSQSLIDFRRRMDVDIGIFTTRKHSDFRQYIPNWDMVSIAMTLPEKNLALIKNLSEESMPDISLESQTLFYKDNDNTYEVTFKSIPELSQENTTFWVFISDVSKLINSQNKALFNNIFLSVSGLVITSLLVLLISWRPLSRLREITEELPNLASQHRAFLKRHKLSSQRKRFILDESDVVRSSAIRLAKRLKVLNDRIGQRTQELEDNAIKLASEKAFIDTLLDTAQALILTQDKDGNIKLVNHYAQWISGYSRKEISGKPLKSILAEEDNLDAVDTILNQIHDGSNSHGRHHTDLKTKHGDRVHMAWYHSKLKLEKGDYQLITVALDITDRKRIEENLGHLANNDPLTGLYNRRRFTEEMEQVISTSHRYDHSSALLFFDLDNFKDVNDLSGHHAGDELLTRVAEVLRKESRESDVLARLGGDEFAVILKETNEIDALISAKRFCKALNKVQIQVGPNTHQVSSSIGVALYPEHGNDLKSVLANADMAMYKAKEEGRNRVIMYSEESTGPQQLKQRVYWNQKASEMIAESKALMFYQPIWNIKQRHISHYEALLRVKDGDEIYPPMNLINAAERNNIIFDIDRLVLEQVMMDLSHLGEQGISMRFNVNISGISFQNRELVTHVCDLITKYQIDPTQLTFEVTETAAVADVTATSDVMNKLKDLGIQIALDDFGVGFSSIYYLKHFPIDYIKIDGSFIKNLNHDKDSQILVKAIVQVAQSFNQKTVAEFVESEEILNILMGLGVDYAQGYYIKHPAPLNELIGPKD